MHICVQSISIRKTIRNRNVIGFINFCNNFTCHAINWRFCLCLEMGKTVRIKCTGERDSMKLFVFRSVAYFRHGWWIKLHSTFLFNFTKFPFSCSGMTGRNRNSSINDWNENLFFWTKWEVHVRYPPQHDKVIVKIYKKIICIIHHFASYGN